NAVDPVPSSGLTYRAYWRLTGASGAFTSYPTSVTSGSALTLSAANSYDIYLVATDNAGNTGPASNTVVAVTYFPWEHQTRLPAASPQPYSGAAVIAGSRFAVAYENGGAVGAEAWVDNADGFATYNRLDTTAHAIAPVGTTNRALFVSPFAANFTIDQGRNFAPITLNPSNPGGTFYAA